MEKLQVEIPSCSQQFKKITSIGKILCFDLTKVESKNFYNKILILIEIVTYGIFLQNTL